MKKNLVQALLVFIVIILAVLAPMSNPVAAFIPDYQYNLNPPTSNPAGWVKVRWLLTASGCSGCTCGAEWTPGSQTGLFEKPGDRTPRGHNEGDDSAPGGGAVNDPRAQCSDGEWAAGTWYHNAIFPVVWTLGPCTWHGSVYVCTYNGSWGAATWDGWNFAENDDCCVGGICDDPDPDPTPCACPGDSWSYATPSTTLIGIEPPYPLVVGQDPEDVGATLVFQNVLGPSTHTWYGPDCPACPAHTATVQDTLSNGGTVDFNLTEASKDWIINEVGRLYPGAAPKHPDWIAEELVWSSCYRNGDDHVCTGRAHFPAEDPGLYDAQIYITAALNGPRTHGPYAFLNAVQVWLLETRLYQ
jgi:hypothetical protein